MAYDNLDCEKIIEMIRRLGKRIEARFPDSDLFRVCQALLEISRRAHQRTLWIARPIIWLRFTICLLIAFICVGVCTTLVMLPIRMKTITIDVFIPVLEAATSEIVVLGAGLFFLISIEKRIKSKRALVAIHEIRSVAHIIDMHQLTKDPEQILNPGRVTSSSPKMTLSHFELGRNLDYCSELLSLTGKIAALYVQQFYDAIALASATEVESLVTGLSRKIWQKIMILHSFEHNKLIMASTP